MRTAKGSDSPHRHSRPAYGRVLLLTPSRGLGGGIERYVESVEWAIAALGIPCRRLDLERASVHAYAAMLADGRTVLRASPEPARLIVGHQALLPVAMLLGREPTACGIWVVCHGAEAWKVGRHPRRKLERRLMRAREVHVVAASAFTAGALAAHCRATILPPGLSRQWFKTLVAAASSVCQSPTFQIATAFRLSDWREKGLSELILAIASLGRDDISLAVCGTGHAPPDLQRLIAGCPWCTLRAGLTDDELAGQFATSDLFVLATRTRPVGHRSGEGFGLVLLEAQVAGTPVIAPAHGGSPDAYVEGVTGIAPADETAEALARALKEMLGNPDRLAWMGKRAAEWARESFAPERYAELVARRLL